jgi:hypothetical protein
VTVGAPRLTAELAELGYGVTNPTADFVVVRYSVEVGPLADEFAELGWKVPADYHASAPGGLLVRPHLLPLNGNGGEHPWCGVHPSSVGGIADGSFQYWSRPHPDWVNSTRDAAALMAHIRHLFDTLPEELRPARAA